MTETGTISIHAENILPIIKKWLYSEKEIFLRELVANAADAMHKLHRMNVLGEETRELEKFAITISCDKNARTVTITDTGIGMTADEIKKYINQVAFSGLRDFVEKYQDKDTSQQVIGHFGLGFYSSFMVADRVEIDSLSCRKGAEAAHWSCDGSINFSLSASERETHGTSVVLHIAAESEEMLEETTLQGILHKYCAFVKYPIFMGGRMINDPEPLWTKSPSQLGDKDYLDFFHKLFPLSPDPLFWIHLNVDYPFALKGVLYFPRLQHELDASQGEVKLYCNQVFVSDNLKEIVPDYLVSLKGTLDCADLPLNVSRSYLQNDPQVRKISQHISKKVADKLVGLAKTEQEKFRGYWKDIHPFIKYGMMRDQDLYTKLIPHVVYATTKGEYLTLDGYLEKNREQTDNKIVYASDVDAQATYVTMFEEQGIDVIITDTLIDNHFISYAERQSEKRYNFQRIDSDLAKNLVSSSASKIIDPKDNLDASEKISDLFRKSLERPGIKVRVENLKSTKVPAMLVFDETTRRMQDMARFSKGLGHGEPTAGEHTLVVNQNNGAIKRLLTLAASTGRERDIKMMVNQIYDLAYLQHGRLSSEMMKNFVERSASIMERMGNSGAGLVI